MPALGKDRDSSPLESRRRRGADDSSSGSDDSSSGSDDSSSGGGSSDDIVVIDGVPVKVRGDGSIDDSQPTGLVSTATGLKLRGDGSIDDSQPGLVRILGTRRSDDLFGTGIAREALRGRRGKDDFFLGDRRGSFYLKSRRRSKDSTFAIIEDFRRGDDVVLHGSRSEYRFAITSRAGVEGLGIFHRGNKGRDLVALLAGREALPLAGIDFIG